MNEASLRTTNQALFRRVSGIKRTKNTSVLKRMSINWTISVEKPTRLGSNFCRPWETVVPKMTKLLRVTLPSIMFSMFLSCTGWPSYLPSGMLSVPKGKRKEEKSKTSASCFCLTCRACSSDCILASRPLCSTSICFAAAYIFWLSCLAAKELYNMKYSFNESTTSWYLITLYSCFTWLHCYRAAAMQPRSSYEHLSVCLSVKRVDCDKTKAPSEKSSIMTDRKSATSFPMSLRWTAYVAPKPPKRGSKTAKWPLFV